MHTSSIGVSCPTGYTTTELTLHFQVADQAITELSTVTVINPYLYTPCEYLSKHLAFKW